MRGDLPITVIKEEHNAQLKGGMLGRKKEIVRFPLTRSVVVV
jgi:hypothetical protein